jgi:hypothetical protein
LQDTDKGIVEEVSAIVQWILNFISQRAEITGTIEEEHIACIIRLERISELGTMLGVAVSC